MILMYHGNSLIFVRLFLVSNGILCGDQMKHERGYTKFPGVKKKEFEVKYYPFQFISYK